HNVRRAKPLGIHFEKTVTARIALNAELARYIAHDWTARGDVCLPTLGATPPFWRRKIPFCDCSYWPPSQIHVVLGLAFAEDIDEIGDGHCRSAHDDLSIAIRH